MERYRSSQMACFAINPGGQPLAAQYFRMHANDQHFLVIGPIEDADPPAFRQPAGRAPEKIMFQFFGARLFETEDLAALRIDPGHDVPDGAVLAGRVHRLKDQQHRIAVGRVVQALQLAQLLNAFVEQFVIVLLRLEEWLHLRRALAEFELFSRRHLEVC